MPNSPWHKRYLSPSGPFMLPWQHRYSIITILPVGVIKPLPQPGGPGAHPVMAFMVTITATRLRQETHTGASWCLGAAGLTSSDGRASKLAFKERLQHRIHIYTSLLTSTFTWKGGGIFHFHKNIAKSTTGVFPCFNRQKEQQSMADKFSLVKDWWLPLSWPDKIRHEKIEAEENYNTDNDTNSYWVWFSLVNF